MTLFDTVQSLTYFVDELSLSVANAQMQVASFFQRSPVGWVCERRGFFRYAVNDRHVGFTHESLHFVVEKPPELFDLSLIHVSPRILFDCVFPGRPELRPLVQTSTNTSILRAIQAFFKQKRRF